MMLDSLPSLSPGDAVNQEMSLNLSYPFGVFYENI